MTFDGNGIAFNKTELIGLSKIGNRARVENLPSPAVIGPAHRGGGLGAFDRRTEPGVKETTRREIAPRGLTNKAN